MNIKARMNVCFLWAGLIVLIALPVIAQPPAAPAPAPEVGQLSFFAGEWSCKGKVETTPFGPAHATQATVHISKELGGFWYVGHYAEKKTAPLEVEVLISDRDYWKRRDAGVVIRTQ